VGEALGYRIEYIFDAWKDLYAPRPDYVPGHKRLSAEKWAREQVPNGLNPATAARRVTEHYLRDGTMLLPPRRFDRDVDGRGGVFVSFRERLSDSRLAREGFWHFDPEDADGCRDLVLATVRTLISPRGVVTAENLPKLKIGVSFFSPLEKVKPGKLGFMRYDIVARSGGFETKMGGRCRTRRSIRARLSNTRMRAGAMRRFGLPSRTICSGTRSPNSSSRGNTGCPMARTTIPRGTGRIKRRLARR
jgi:hypothetical protein